MWPCPSVSLVATGNGCDLSFAGHHRIDRHGVIVPPPLQAQRMKPMAVIKSDFHRMTCTQASPSSKSSPWRRRIRGKAEKVATTLHAAKEGNGRNSCQSCGGSFTTVPSRNSFLPQLLGSSTSTGDQRCMFLVEFWARRWNMRISTAVNHTTLDLSSE